MIAGAQDAAHRFENRDILVDQQYFAGAVWRRQRTGWQNLFVRRRLEWHFDGKGRSMRLHVSDANRSAVFADDAVADAQAQSSALPYWLGCVERIEDFRWFADAGTVIGKLDYQAIPAQAGVYPQVAVAGGLENRVHGIVYQIEEYLLKLVRISQVTGKSDASSRCTRMFFIRRS